MVSLAVAKSVVKNIRVSPRKLNLVAGQIRGKRVRVALDELAFSRKRIAIDVRKALMSAVANAENNHGMDVDQLIVDEAYVGQAFIIKRFHARAKGRGASIRKPFSNLTIKVREQED